MNRRQALFAISGGLGLIGVTNFGKKLFRRRKARLSEFSAVTLGIDTVTKATFLTEAFLNSGEIRQVKLPMKYGHSILCLPERRLMCIGRNSTTSLVIDGENNVIKKIEAPQGYMYGGHGLVFLNQKQVFLTAHAATATSERDSGLIQVFSLDKMELIGQFSSHGIHPDEIRMLPGKSSYVVIHSGKLPKESNLNPEEFTFGVLNPKLSVFSVETNSPRFHHPLTPNYAVFAHMDIGPDGRIYCINNQFWKTDFFRESRPESEFGDHDFPLDTLEEKDRVAVPLPLVVIDPVTGKQTNVFSSSKIQRGSQSVATNFLMKKVVATYPTTNTILIVDRDLSVSAVDARSFGILGVKGVCEIPFTSEIVVTGGEENFAVIDLKSMQKVQSFPVKMNSSIHVSIRS